MRGGDAEVGGLAASHHLRDEARTEAQRVHLGPITDTGLARNQSLQGIARSPSSDLCKHETQLSPGTHPLLSLHPVTVAELLDAQGAGNAQHGPAASKCVEKTA